MMLYTSVLDAYRDPSIRRPGERMVVVAPPAMGCPTALLDQFDQQHEMFQDGVTLIEMHTPKRYRRRRNIRRLCTFFSRSNLLDYRPPEPARLPSIEPIDVDFRRMFARIRRMGPNGGLPHLVVAQVPPPRNGVYSLGGNNDYTWDLIMAGVPVFVQVNPRLPWVNGNHFPADRVVGAIYTNIPVLEQRPKPSKSEKVDLAIARRIADKIRELRKGKRLVLQVGVGAIPDLVVAMLAGEIDEIWSEVLTDGMAGLDIPMVGTFVLGTEGGIISHVRDNPKVRLLPARITNGPDMPAGLISVLQATGATFRGGTTVGPNMRITGVGGAGNFAEFAEWCIVAVRSTYGGKSNFTAGADPRSHMTLPNWLSPDFLVSECGMADCRESVQVVAARIIEQCVHPDLRDWAWNEALEADIPLEARVRRPQQSLLQELPGQVQVRLPLVYLHDWKLMAEVPMGDTVVTLRLLAQHDRDNAVGCVERLSPESVYKRYFAVRVPYKEPERLARVDHIDHEVLGAFADGQLIGMVEYMLLRENRAEWATFLLDNWHGQGLGTVMAALLVDVARHRGIEFFDAEFLTTNKAPAAVIARVCGDPVTPARYEGETTSASWRLPDLAAAG